MQNTSGAQLDGFRDPVIVSQVAGYTADQVGQVRIQIISRRTGPVTMVEGVRLEGSFAKGELFVAVFDQVFVDKHLIDSRLYVSLDLYDRIQFLLFLYGH
jgi:hypothetical protein